MQKISLGLMAAVVVTILAARFAYGVKVNEGVMPGNDAWAQNKMEFVTWNQHRWTAWVRDGVFEQIPQDTGNWSRHANASIAYTDWDGEPWQAKVDGDVFLLAHRGNWQGPVERSEGIRYRDWSGNKQLRTIADIRR